MAGAWVVDAFKVKLESPPASGCKGSVQKIASRFLKSSPLAAGKATYGLQVELRSCAHGGAVVDTARLGPALPGRRTMPCGIQSLESVCGDPLHR